MVCLVDVHGLVGLGKECFYFALGFRAGWFRGPGEAREGGEGEIAGVDGGTRGRWPWYSTDGHRRRRRRSVASGPEPAGSYLVPNLPIGFSEVSTLDNGVFKFRN